MIEVRPEQPEKALSPILFAPSRMVREVRLDKFLKIPLVIFAMPKVAEARLLQSSKAELPILVTELGIVREVRFEQPTKA